MDWRKERFPTRPHTAVTARAAKREERDPHLDVERLKTVIMWIHSRSRSLRKLAKVVLREVCSYLHEEISIVYCMHIYDLHVLYLQSGKGQKIRIQSKLCIPGSGTNVPIDNKRFLTCGGASNHHTVSATATTASAFMIHTDGTVGELASMRTPRAYHGIVVYRNKVLVFGGSHGNMKKMFPTKKCEEFTLRSGRWSALADMRISRSRCSTTRLGDRLYIYGGDHALKIEVYALLTNAFRVTELSLPSDDVCSGFVRDGKVVILQSTHRITVSSEGRSDIMEITEGEGCYYAGGYPKYWRGKVYYYGGANSYWIDPDSPGVSNFVHIMAMYSERSY